jgi:hypothetical protein
MKVSEEAWIQKEKFKVKLIPSDLPKGEKDRRLFEVFDMLLALNSHQNQKIESKLDTPQK